MILVACPACDRQYDVTHVPAGNRVRCVCDAIIRVGAQGSLEVRALHCSHCSGALEGDEETCRWCGAKLSAADRRATTLCPKCFARIADDARHCQGCGVAIAPQALTPLPEDKACSRCSGELQIRSLGAIDVIECSACGGLWLAARVFEAVCRDAERRFDALLSAKARPDASAAAPPAANQRYIPCLTCRELMLRRNFRRGSSSSGVVVDVCRDHGVWLDRDELERILRFVRTGGPASLFQGASPLDVPYDAERARRRRLLDQKSIGGFPDAGSWDGVEAVLRLIFVIADAIF